MKKVTKHGRKRLKERNINQGRNGIFTSARLRGKTSFYFEGEFRDYLISRMSSGIQVKVYKNNIYIYSRNSKNLITTYPVPEKYLPVEQYLVDNNKRYAIENIRIYYRKDCIVTLKDEEIIKGIIEYKLYDDYGNLLGIVVNDKECFEYEIMIDDIESVQLNSEDFNKELILEMGLAV